MRSLLALVALTAFAASTQAQTAHHNGDHPAVVVQRLQAQAGYDYQNTFYPPPSMAVPVGPRSAASHDGSPGRHRRPAPTGTAPGHAGGEKPRCPTVPAQVRCRHAHGSLPRARVHLQDLLLMLLGPQLAARAQRPRPAVAAGARLRCAARDGLRALPRPRLPRLGRAVAALRGPRGLARTVRAFGVGW